MNRLEGTTMLLSYCLCRQKIRAKKPKTKTKLQYVGTRVFRSNFFFQIPGASLPNFAITAENFPQYCSMSPVTATESYTLIQSVYQIKCRQAILQRSSIYSRYSPTGSHVHCVSKKGTPTLSIV